MAIDPRERSDPFDVAVIGGGINGCGIARDAAGRGARVVLFEQGDLAQGTSSASTKLIHGGLRYLEHREFALVRESLEERERLWAVAPHLIRPQRFVLPWVKGLRPRWLLRLGLFVYDHIGGRRALPATQTVDLRRHPAGRPLRPRFTTGFVYSDCRVDDARLVVLNARSAADLGAEVRTRCKVTGFTREGELWRIETAGGTVRAGALVNASGPWAAEVLALGSAGGGHRLRLVRGSHIVVPQLFDHPFAYFFQLPDGRIFFAIPYQDRFTLIGTTDRDHDGPLDRIVPAAEEIAYLCEGASRYFARPLAPEDVVHAWAGVRPLVDDGSNRPEAATRGYVLDLSEPEEGAPLLTVFGGKLTTYRQLAETAIDRLAPRLGVLGQAWTAQAPLPGGDFPRDGVADLAARLATRYPFLVPASADRLASAYGTLAFDLLGEAASLADCGEDFGHGLTAREVDWLVAHEWACTAEDVLWRRSKLGLLFDRAQTDRLAAALAERAP